MADQLFVPVDLRPYFNVGRRPAAGRWHPATVAALAELPQGPQRFWGIPFALAPVSSSELRVPSSESRPRPASPELETRNSEPAWVLLGDLTGSQSGVSLGETVVWVGTENRQHLLGHLSLLGVRGEAVFPMTTSGPPESYLGDPTWTTLAEWADEARRRDGIAVLPHFPTP